MTPLSALVALVLWMDGYVGGVYSRNYCLRLGSLTSHGGYGWMNGLMNH